MEYEIATSKTRLLGDVCYGMRKESPTGIVLSQHAAFTFDCQPGSTEGVSSLYEYEGWADDVHVALTMSSRAEQSCTASPYTPSRRRDDTAMPTGLQGWWVGQGGKVEGMDTPRVPEVWIRGRPSRLVPDTVILRQPVAHVTSGPRQL